MWSQQATDNDWTANLVGYLDALLDAADISPTILKNVDCRRTLCRVALRAVSLSSLRGLSSLARGDGMRFVYSIDGGRDGTAITIFLARQGLEEASLPDDG